jgi:hypothetical protein
VCQVAKIGIRRRHCETLDDECFLSHGRLCYFIM